MDPHGIGMQSIHTPHETPQQTFEKDPQIYISPVSILPPSAAARPVHEEPPRLMLPTTSRPIAPAEHARGALVYVKTREPVSWELLQSLAVKGQSGTAYERLKAGMEAGRRCGSSQASEAYKTVERALGKWVVHEHKYNGAVYSPSAEEQDVLSRWGGRNGHVGLQREFERSIDEFARQEKVAYKKELDARKDALEGILSSDHAKLVNNQKSAHLSKFMGLVSTQAKDRMIAWLMEAKYGSSYNLTYFDQHISM